MALSADARNFLGHGCDFTEGCALPGDVSAVRARVRSSDRSLCIPHHLLRCGRLCYKKTCLHFDVTERKDINEVRRRK